MNKMRATKKIFLLRKIKENPVKVPKRREDSMIVRTTTPMMMKTMNEFESTRENIYMLNFCSY